MRICLIAAIAALLSTAATSVAAPTSMMQTLPQAGASQAHSEPARMGWLTKWFRQEKAAQPVIQPAAPPIATYQAPPSEAPAAVAPQAIPPAAPVASTAPTLPPATSAADCRSLRKEGHAHDRAGDLAAAEGLYRRAIGADPTNPAAYNDLGLCLARQERLDESAGALRQAIALRPDKPLYRNNIATVLVEQGYTDEALKNLKTVYGLGAAHYNLGQLLDRAGKRPEAIGQLQVALRHEPGFAPARDTLAAWQVPAPALAAAPVLDVPPPPVTPAPVETLPPSTPIQRVAAAPMAKALPAEPSGAPSFPRLLPPVLEH